MKAVDLFCGRGGWTRGLLDAGFDVTGYDLEPQPDYPARFVQADVRQLSAADLGEPAVIVASPPCTGFSLVNASRLKGDRPHAADLELLLHAVRLVAEARPRFWAIENVRGALAWWNPALGTPSLKAPPFYLWGFFPPFLLERARLAPKRNGWYKGKRYEKAASVSAEIPAELARPFAEACAAALAPVPLAGQQEAP